MPMQPKDPMAEIGQAVEKVWDWARGDRAEAQKPEGKTPETIYTGSRRWVASSAVGVDYGQELDWAADVATVDNLSNQWLFVTAASRWVAPGIFGAVILIRRGTRAEFSWSTPPGYTPAANPSGSATVTFTERSAGVVTSPGVVVPTP